MSVVYFCLLLSGLFLVQSVVAQTPSERVLFDFDGAFDLASVEAHDVAVALAPTEDDGKALRIKSGYQAEWPGITMKAPDGRWDFSTAEYLALDVANVGTNVVGVFCRVDNPGADGVRNCVTGSVELAPGERKTLHVSLTRKLPEMLAAKLFGMRGYPGGLAKDAGIDAGAVNQLLVFVSKPTQDHEFEIDSIRVGGVYETPAWLSMSPDAFFPLMDEYGQFIHKDWPNKVHSEDDLKAHLKAETDDLTEHSGPEDWDGYGGWKSGPQLDATGFFRVEKYQDKWWLVDPDGHLFWSHGVDCVHAYNGVTPITDRRHWFRDLPDSSSPFRSFYGHGNWAPHNYYEGKTYETYNFTSANLLRKYGDEWPDRFEELAHQRLRSWGLNTIGNWSSSAIYLLRKTPYVATVSTGGPTLQGSEGYWGKFMDVFDSRFKESVQQHMARQVGKSAGDPWCLGYFVDNELSWGDEVSLAVATLVSPPEQAAKGVFIADLKAKYETVARLNAAWGSEYASWDALAQSRTAPDRTRARDDLIAFYRKTAETYFKTVREAVKEVAPHQLYLGCRFAWGNAIAAHAAAEYCDVISYNFYRRSVADVRLPDAIDKPIIIGEFHFGALDRGMFHTGLVPTANQEARADAYRNYVRGALENPLIVGTHWFQFGDQATTGRGDGENYQIGFLDIADTPYPETIQAVREVGYALYSHRLGKTADTAAK